MQLTKKSKTKPEKPRFGFSSDLQKNRGFGLKTDPSLLLGQQALATWQQDKLLIGCEQR